MYCWNCGARNSEENSFCGQCGKRIAKATEGQAEGQLHAEAVTPVTPRANVPVDPAPLPGSPLVEEPRVVRDSPRTLAQMEIAPPSNVAVEEPPSRRVEAQSKREPLIMSRTSLPPNRITGPSFLGLSDEPNLPSHDSSYLLEEDEPRRSSWRAWVALAVLAIFGFLIYKQWNAIRDGASAVAAHATGEGDETTEHQKPSPQPPASVSSAAETQPTNDATTGSSQTEIAQNTSPVSPAEAAQSSVDKPENDQNGAATKQEEQSSSATSKGENVESASSSESSDSTDTATSSDESDSADTASETAKEPATPPAKSASKRAAPAAPSEPQFNNAPVEQAERYLSGRGAAQDCSRAISLLRSSAREGNPRAQVKLGALYATGQCVTQDRAAAYQWLLRAHEAQPSNSYLQRTMNSLWTNMTPEERDRITR